MKPWPLTIRVLHLGLALVVTIQLLTAMFIDVELDHIVLTTKGLLFKIHEYSGLTALIITILHIVIILMKPERCVAYFPWSQQGRLLVGREVKDLTSGNLPKGGYLSGGLVGFVHGLGLLAVLAAASLGAVVFIALQQYPASAGFIKPAVESHQVLASLVVVYWLAHVGMGLWHFLTGDREIMQIFSRQ